MVDQEGGRWDVGIEKNAVHLERISDSDKRLFDDSLTPDEARQLAELLNKFADKAEESDDSEDSDKKDSDKKDSDTKDDDNESDDEDDSGDEDEDAEDSDKSST